MKKRSGFYAKYKEDIYDEDTGYITGVKCSICSYTKLGIAGDVNSIGGCSHSITGHIKREHPDVEP